MRPEDANLVVKAQVIRLYDVFVIGPLMMYGAYNMQAATPAQKAARFLLAGAGIATVLFNGRNYLMIDALRRGD